MPRVPVRLAALSLGAVAAIVMAACGGSSATATPQSTATRAAPTATPAPVATATTAAQPTTAAAATRPASTANTAPPTATSAPAPTATPVLSVPTPVVKQPAKTGGTLQLRLITGSTLTAYDTFDVGGTVEFSAFGPMLNNLIWPDPYGTQIVGDIAEGWTITSGGTVMTFALRKGIKYHDGTPFTSKDVAYNIERGLNPRDTRMTQFRARFTAITKIETPDENTVRLTLSQPSNVLVQALAHAGVLMYPSSMPFPEKKDDWKKAPIGTGPYKVSRIDPTVRLEYVKYPDYFKRGMPYLDGLVLTLMTNDVAVAAFRAGRLDAAMIDGSSIVDHLDELKKAHNWTAVQHTVSTNPIYLAQREPFTNVKVREAIDLAIDREGVVQAWLHGRGTRLSGPLMPPEIGGQWGLSSQELSTRLAFQEDKTQAMAAAKKLIQESGVDPSKFTLKIIGNTTYPQYGEIVDGSVRDLGFKTDYSTPTSAVVTDRLVRGDFDIYVTTLTLSYDDPKDQLSSYVTSAGGFNYGKWVNPKIDSLMEEQDRTLDVAKRKDLIRQLQLAVLDDHVLIPVLARFSYKGYMPWVKNFPTNAPFTYSGIFRWEQVWVEK